MIRRAILPRLPTSLEPVARRLVISVSVVLAALAIVEAWMLLSIIDRDAGWFLGMDYAFYRGVGEQWLADGTYYRPHQLAGPYDVTLMVDVLYPPVALLLFVPFTIIPGPLWWGIPLGILAWSWWRWRPASWTWPVVLALLMWPRSMAAFLYGNTDIWIAAGVAGGLLAGWPALLVLLKPTLLPFVFVGAWHRWWWVIPVALLLSVALAFPLWQDYITVIRNLRIGWEYSLGSLPLACIPLVLWFGRKKIAEGGIASEAPANRTFGAVTSRTGRLDS